MRRRRKPIKRAWNKGKGEFSESITVRLRPAQKAWLIREGRTDIVRKMLDLAIKHEARKTSGTK